MNKKAATPSLYNQLIISDYEIEEICRLLACGELFHGYDGNRADLLGFEGCVLGLRGNFLSVNLGNAVLRHAENLGADLLAKAAGDAARSVKCRFHFLLLS
jgi:hypothetical protein